MKTRTSPSHSALPLLPLLALLLACPDHTLTAEQRRQGATTSGPASRPSGGATSRPSKDPHSDLERHGGKGAKKILEARGGLPDTKGLDALLQKVVRDGRVDYEQVKKEREVLDEFLKAVAKTDISKVDKQAKLAFYINAYNAATLDLVLRHVLGKVSGVLEVEKQGGKKFFEDKLTIVGGKALSLNELEKLGRDLGDPRIHFAVNCASVSCPPLLNRVWKAETLEQDLVEATKAYLASPQGLQVAPDGLRLSKIFDWYKQDWGGLDSVKNFLQLYAPDAAKEKLSSELGWLEYDWNLNRIPG